MHLHFLAARLCFFQKIYAKFHLIQLCEVNDEYELTSNILCGKLQLRAHSDNLELQ